MGTEVRGARELLLNALQQYSAADSEAEIERAVLALHTGLEESFRAYLRSLGHDEVDHLEVSFPDLVDLIRDHTDLFEGDASLPPLLVSLNTTRTKIAHPRGDKPPPEKIANDASQLNRLTRRFWPKLFGESCPVSLVAPPQRSKLRTGEHIVSEPFAKSGLVEPKLQQLPSTTPKFGQFLRLLWKDENQPHFQRGLFLKRVIWIAILFTLAKWSKSGAISTARWPEPIKYGGVALFLLAAGLFLWEVLTIWKLLRQLRLRGLLIVLGIGYVLLISALVLTSGSPLPFHQEAWLTTQRLIVGAGHKVHDVGQALVEAPEEFRFAYTGHRRPVLLPGMDAEDTSYLTPIPANRPAQLSLSATSAASPTRVITSTQKGTPSPVPPISVTVLPLPSDASTPAVTLMEERPTVLPVYPPDCPHPQARLTAPQMNEVIRDEVQVKGTANIENFDYYKFEFKREDVEDEWHWVESFETPVEEGLLGIWHVSQLPPGTYTFRLTVVNREGNYPFPPCEVRVYVTH
jgi:hypothetical protein